MEIPARYTGKFTIEEALEYIRQIKQGLEPKVMTALNGVALSRMRNAIKFLLDSEKRWLKEALTKDTYQEALSCFYKETFYCQESYLALKEKFPFDVPDIEMKLENETDFPEE